MAWWTRDKEKKPVSADRRSIPPGVWQKCTSCGAILDSTALVAALRVCPQCGYHFHMPVAERIRLIVDDGSFDEHDAGLTSLDPLGFVDSKPYPARLQAAMRSVGPGEAFRAGSALIQDRPVETGFFVFEFIGGSMGSVVGEKVARLFERALDRRVPAILFCASGGARMQEGILSLMQMAKTTAVLATLREAGVPYIAVLLDPTTGGTAASFAMLGDVIIAEPGALIGFAGQRVIEQTIRQKLPPGFRLAEFHVEHGMVDLIVPRIELRARLAQLVRLLAPVPLERHV